MIVPTERTNGGKTFIGIIPYGICIMTTPISPKEQTELYHRITEKILFIGDSGDDEEQEKKIFKKAKQRYIILLGDFVVTSHLDRKAAEKETKKGLENLNDMGFPEEINALNFLLRTDNELVRETLNDCFSINRYNKEVKEKFNEIKKRLNPIKEKKVFIAVGNHDFNLKELYKDYLKVGGKKLNIQFLNPERPLKIGQIEIYTIPCRGESILGKSPDQMLSKSEIKQVEKNLEKSTNPIKILVSHLPSSLTHPNLGSQQISGLLPKTTIFFHGHCFNYQNTPYRIINNLQSQNPIMISNAHLYSEKRASQLLNHTRSSPKE